MLRGKASRKHGIPLPADVGAALSATGITNARAKGYTPRSAARQHIPIPALST
ncbi:hypothetical protein MFM001_46570 [Mycobacterium sp. MFM001]|uniref:hypothetical protein n=1 Tax=Mycobacterium sp. MFM001 TaxID=2049453 RepID=UPI000DA50FAC|nr:hypothetical protein [Mycobacterium sp. MFM001]GBE68195.1 hypothetical protein MFM001_46570 [Mycobacterium sp. MFM001]